MRLSKVQSTNEAVADETSVLKAYVGSSAVYQLELDDVVDITPQIRLDEGNAPHLEYRTAVSRFMG